LQYTKAKRIINPAAIPIRIVFRLFILSTSIIPE
jgi:hypothetical protein